MLKRRKKKDPCAGSVLFRGSPAPRPEHMGAEHLWFEVHSAPHERGARGDLGAEHLWFEVHSAGDDHVDGTLLNQPFANLGMSQGDRGKRPLELLSDWGISTPAGMISPRSLAPARMMREHRSEILQMMTAG
jgi:hypothetical protein